MTITKYSFTQLKTYLCDNGKTFTQFMDAAGKPPSRRTWSDGTHPEKGVTKVTVARMRTSIEKVFAEWELDLPEEVKIAIEIK